VGSVRNLEHRTCLPKYTTAKNIIERSKYCVNIKQYTTLRTYNLIYIYIYVYIYIYNVLTSALYGYETSFLTLTNNIDSEFLRNEGNHLDGKGRR
jgi:predicted CDP-diglyceride synthetase/phosphatidate cytidylyltransferase